ncbi:MFS transporter [Streptomyces sp. TS71-3]|uniref:MFS transporter n=1 Tax=Streptomyces sp. TS71-3 TaxID=2733862 RepID=UPI001BB31E6D|nr:MFS transporter [Streptomyces sp. TS71-3]
MSALEPRDAPAGAAETADEPDGEGAAADPGAEAAPEADGARGVLSPPYLPLSLGIVSVVLVIAFEATAVGTAMPVAARELHGLSLYAFGFSAFFTTSLLGMVLAGQWADRQGPLASLGTGIGAFAAGLVVAGTASSMWLFVLGRAVQGLGGGLVIVALYVVVGRAYPERLRPSIMAGFAAGWVVPSVVGPLVSGAVTEQLGWRWVFLGIPVLVVFPLALALPQIRRRASGPPESIPAGAPEPIPSGAPEPIPSGARAGAASGAGAAGNPEATAAPDAGRAARAAGRRRIRLALGVSVGAGLVQYAAQDLAWRSLIPLAAGAALLVPSVLRLLPPGTYRAVRGLPSVVLLRGVAAGSFIAAESFVPLMLVTQRGLSPTLAGLSLALGGATWSLGSYVQSRPRAQPHRERLMAAGMLLVTLAIAAVPTALIEAVPVWIVALAWGVGCLGMGLVISSTSVLLLKLSAPHEAGANSAALQISDGLSNALLLAAGGAAFAALGGGSVAPADTAGSAAATATASHPAAFTVVFLPMAVVALAGVWVTTRLRKREREPGRV